MEKELIKYGKNFIFRGTLIRNHSGISHNNANFCVIEFCPNCQPKAWFFKSKSSATKFYKTFSHGCRELFVHAYKKKENNWFLCYPSGLADRFFDTCYKDDAIVFVNN